LILTNKNGASFYQFFNFRRFSGIHHAIFTRHAGYSGGPYKSLNISFGIGDDANNVQKNRHIISQCIQGKEFVFVEQVHGDNVLIIDGCHHGDENKKTASSSTGDAMVTHLRQTFLVVQVADCQSVMLYDPNREVVANIHVGWRGSIKNIIGRTLKAMVEHFGCLTSEIVAGVGPSLGPCCAEFVNYKLEIPEEFWTYKDTSHHFDFWTISRDQLVAAGVLDENITISKICTKCNTDVFFSYRGEGTTGRFAAVIGLK
jgi:YfiH family protein